MSGGQFVVMYLEKDSPDEEKFSLPMTYDGAQWAAKKLERDGFEVIAVLTEEGASERKQVQQAQAGGQSLEGVHLDQFLNETVRGFRRMYPGVSREAALEATALLCTLWLEGRRDLQDALLDEVHSAPLAGAPDWRREIRFAIANRRPEGEK